MYILCVFLITKKNKKRVKIRLFVLIFRKINKLGECGYLCLFLQ